MNKEPTWTREDVEKAINLYFEIENFNQVAKEYDIPITTLFYKVKADPRYNNEKEMGWRGRIEGLISRVVDESKIFDSTKKMELVGQLFGIIVGSLEIIQDYPELANEYLNKYEKLSDEIVFGTKSLNVKGGGIHDFLDLIEEYLDKAERRENDHESRTN